MIAEHVMILGIGSQKDQQVSKMPSGIDCHPYKQQQKKVYYLCCRKI